MARYADSNWLIIGMSGCRYIHSRLSSPNQGHRIRPVRSAWPTLHRVSFLQNRSESLLDQMLIVQDFIRAGLNAHHLAVPAANYM